MRLLPRLSAPDGPLPTDSSACPSCLLGHHDEALAVAERGRTRAFADLLVERQTGQQDSDPYSPVTIDQILEMVNGQRGLVLYYSLAAGYLYSWLLAPGAGKVSFLTWEQGNYTLYRDCLMNRGERSMTIDQTKELTAAFSKLSATSIFHGGAFS